MTKDQRLNNSNKCVLITGGSRGIGAATARLFADHAYAVYINYLTDETSARHTEESIHRHGGRCKLIQADVTQEAQVIEMFTSCEASFGAPDILINNAGILHKQARLVEMSTDRIEAVLKTNILGTMLCAREAAKRMSANGAGGVIINVSSGASKTGSPNEYVDYAASKGAIDTLTVGLAKELAEKHIRVNGVRPGMIYTDIHASGGEPGRVDRLASGVPLKRGGRAEEVAEAIFWLASEKASYSTGAILDVAGGL